MTPPELGRPSSLEYHRGPWPQNMRMGWRCNPPTFLGGFLWWSSIEARIRVEMVGSEKGYPGTWGCAV